MGKAFAPVFNFGALQDRQTPVSFGGVQRWKSHSPSFTLVMGLPPILRTHDGILHIREASAVWSPILPG